MVQRQEGKGIRQRLKTLLWILKQSSAVEILSLEKLGTIAVDTATPQPSPRYAASSIHLFGTLESEFAIEDSALIPIMFLSSWLGFRKAW
jgi:hypothetical protein